MYGEVLETRWLTPGLVRLVLGGDGLADYEPTDATDAYVNIAVPPPGAAYAPPFDLDTIRDQVPAADHPVRRRYTVRHWDHEERTLTLDFVVHGDHGVGGPWAATAEPGDVLVLAGPSGSYRPDPTADWHLLVGDESALPAIGASLEAVAAGARVITRLVVDGPEHELDLPTPGDHDLQWLHRSGGCADPDLLPAAVRGLAFPPGRVHAFVHGEATEIRAIRRHLMVDREVGRADLSCSPYWRRDMTDEAWRTVKRDFVASMERDLVGPG